MKNDNAKLKNSKENGRFKKFGFLMAIFVFFTFLFGIHSASADISTGLISNWKLDETSGTTATDSAGTNTGTVTGAVWTTGKLNNALSFNGINNYINFNNDLGVTGELTVSAWVNPAKIPDGIGRLIASTYDWDADATLARGWYFGTVYGITDVMMFRVYDSSGNWGLAQSSGFFASNLNKWAHIVGVYKPSTYIKLFINGVLVSESTTNIPSAVSNKVGTNFRIGAGADYAGHGLWNGLIDDVRVYNRALSVADVTELFNISSPTVVTNSATNITSTATTLNATINPKSPPSTAYFEYGLVSGIYGNQTPTQTLTGSTDQSIFANITGLTANTVYYYRAMATNALGTTNGIEQSFTTTITTDAIAPIGSFAINSNAVSTDSVNVSLNLSATDNTGVSGYYVSESSTAPTASQTGWTTVTSATTYSANPMFTLSSNDGTKTVYVWYKDAAGNVSVAYSDSITLAKDDSWKNWYGIAWRSGGANIPNDVKYAKQMGYPSIVIKGDWTGAYRNNPDLVGLKFFLMTADLYVPVFSNHAVYIDTTLTYSQSDKDFYNTNMVWKSNDAFPNNLASGWFDSATRFQVHWDYQQQAVIDAVVEKIITFAKSMEDKANNFTFGGWMIDVPKLKGDWHYMDTNNWQRSATLSYWTGSDTGIIHDAITHEYATYSDGVAAFYKKLNARMKLEFPNSKWIIDPYYLYSTSASDEWIYQIKDRADKDELTPDMLVQEGAGTQFVDDTNNFNSGVNITKDMVGNAQRSAVSTGTNALIAAKAGINGSWYNWFGQWGIGVGGISDMPNFTEITEVYPRLKLIRLIPNWDNLRNIPLSQRSWNNSTTDPIYSSKKNTTDPNPTSYIDSHLMYSRQWKNNKLFAVFNDNVTPIKLNPNETISSIQCVDGYFIESTDCTSNFTITDTATGKQLKLNSTIVIPTDSTNGQIKGAGYIITTASGASSSSSSSSSVIQSSSSSSSSSSSVLSSSSSSKSSSSSIQSSSSAQSSSSSLVSSSSSSLASSIGNTGGGGGGGGGGGSTPTQSSSSSSWQNSSSSHSSSGIQTSSSSSQTSSTPTPTKTKTITQSLFLGLRSNQVQILQEMLSSDKSIYPEKLITGYYGKMTSLAVIRFQKKHNLETTGAVDLKTQDKLNEIYGKTPPTSSSPKTAPALTETQRQELIQQLQARLKQLLQQLIELLKEKAGR